MTEIICAITLLIVIYLKYDLFIFLNGGHALLMRSILMKPDFLIYLYMIFLNLLLISLIENNNFRSGV